MRLSNFTFLLWASLCLLCSGIGCSNSSTYEPLWNPPQQTDPEEPEEPDDVSFVVYNHLADSPDVNVSTVWEVTLSQNGVEKECMVFQSTCPVYDPSKGMIGSDRTALELVAGRTISWANFSFDGEVTVTARILDPSRVPMSSSVAVYPSRKHVSPSLSGQSVTFTLTEPGQYSVEVGAEGYRNGLMIFANPLEKDAPKSDDAAYRRVENATAADMAALPADRSGIYFARGVHDIGKYIVPAHVKNIYIPGDAYVYGTLVVENNPGVRIFGRGTLSAARLPYRASHSIEATGDSNGMVVEGITIRLHPFLGTPDYDQQPCGVGEDDRRVDLQLRWYLGVSLFDGEKLLHLGQRRQHQGLPRRDHLRRYRLLAAHQRQYHPDGMERRRREGRDGPPR